jgi:predicted  nucleic acid-binding Zn-ribbon protein
MNRNWSDLNREMQALISKKATFSQGLEKLLKLRSELFEQITQIVATFPEEAFHQMPQSTNPQAHRAIAKQRAIWRVWI